MYVILLRDTRVNDKPATISVWVDGVLWGVSQRSGDRW